VRFLDIPSAGHGPTGAILGGAGLAVSASSAHASDAAAFAAWLSGAKAQREVVAPAGGQPGSRSAWLDPVVDRLTGGFTSGTLATMESAYVRPRETWWPPFQLAAGDALNELLRKRAGAAEIYEEVERLYRGALV
jgi:multiple sugar transport system substrate-binding protein